MTSSDSSTGLSSAPPHYPLWGTPRDGIPWVSDTERMLDRAAQALHQGTGPVAVDTERASGFRYGNRTFLLQLRRAGSGTWLIDPEPFENLDPLREALAGTEWILHSATQDLPGIGELGLWPDKLFDTELASRLAGFPRVGLAAMVEQLLGYTLAKEHSAVDWSTRPLPEDWLRYAALDVDVLPDLRERLIPVLQEQGKWEFAQEEFGYLRHFVPPAPKVDPWRKTSGVHKLRDRRALAVVRSLWNERDRLARSRDLAPTMLLPDSALVAAAQAQPHTVPQLLAVKGFHGRSAAKDAMRWLTAIREGRRDPELPPLARPRDDAPPPVRMWQDRDPEAAARIQSAKTGLAEISQQWDIPIENLLKPALLRQLAWQPPSRITTASVGQALDQAGARPWQIQLTAPTLVDAFLDPTPPVPSPSDNNGDNHTDDKTTTQLAT